MRKAKAPRRIPAVIREQIEGMSRERLAACAEAETLREKLMVAERQIDLMSVAGGELRKQLEDMRRQRDRAVDEAESDRRYAAALQRQLDRALGWIDCKTGNAPVLGGPPPYTTEDLMRMTDQ